MDTEKGGRRRKVVAFGPRMEGWGSWDWVGSDLAEEVAGWCETVVFEWREVPDADCVVVVKHPLQRGTWEKRGARVPVVYCPVDFYGSAAEIDGDWRWLARCSRIVVHCERLRRYFSPYAAVRYLDHHVKFVPEEMGPYRADGFVLWVGVRTNLPAMAEWLNGHALSRPLVVLTNPEVPGSPMRAEEFGFSSRDRVTIEEWSPERHLQLAGQASGAIDIKGSDFRSAHKPPTKAMDFLAGGVPLAMNVDSSSTEHLAGMGFEVARPDDEQRWFSREYWEETQRFGRAVKELLSRKRIGVRFRRILEEVLLEDFGRPS